MIATATQQRRHLAVFTALGADELLLHRFTGREELSRLFEFQLEMFSPDDSLDAAEIVGRNMTFLVDREDGNPRYFNGYVSEFAYADQSELATTYKATVVPWLWFLTNTSDCRIFQNQTAPQIIANIFQDLGFGDEFDMSGLSAEYAEREYCVQYRESDFDFVSRLMEEEGIYYFFRHENGRHLLVMADGVSSYFTIDDDQLVYPPPTQTDELADRITGWRHEAEFRTGRWAQTDYDFKKPRAGLMTRQDSALPRQRNKSFEIYDYPGRFEQPDTGRSLTRVRMEEQEAQFETVSGTCTYRSLTPGGRFTVASHRSSAAEGRSYVVTGVEHTASVDGTYLSGTGEDELAFETKFTCIPDAVPFRPRRTTAKPIVEGPQTAVVVGPKGEEIYTDEHARVKCQFHWDRAGSYNEHSSCWMRVSQEHAGKGWGAIDIPRVGEEVIVSFLEGDPDRPIIKGRVYNAQVMPPFSLKGADNATNKTRSGGKTDTYQGSGYNEMTNDDTAGNEQIRTNAQYNMDSNVNNSQTLAVGVDKTEDIGNNDDLTVGVDSAAEVGNDQTTTVGNNDDVIVGNNIVIEAGTSITLACGASTIHMNQAGVITISGQLVSSAATASNSIVAPMTSITGSSMLNQAGMICLDIGGVCHIKGKQTAVDAATVRVDGGLVVVKGAPIKLGEVGAPIVSVPPPKPGSASSANGAGGAGGGGTAGGEAGGQSGGGGETQQAGDEQQAATEVDSKNGSSESEKRPATSDDVAKESELRDEIHKNQDAQSTLREQLENGEVSQEEYDQQRGKLERDHEALSKDHKGLNDSVEWPDEDDPLWNERTPSPQQDDNTTPPKNGKTPDANPNESDLPTKTGHKVGGGVSIGKDGAKAEAGGAAVIEVELQKNEGTYGPFTAGHSTTADAEIGVGTSGEKMKVGVDKKVYVKNQLGDELYCKGGVEGDTKGNGAAGAECGITGALNKNEKVSVAAGKSTDKKVFGAEFDKKCVTDHEQGTQTCTTTAKVTVLKGSAKVSYENTTKLPNGSQSGTDSGQDNASN